jgi:hypothetical protein
VTPDLHHLATFPFISDSAYAGSGNDPMKVLLLIKEYINLENGALWLAAGMSISAFNILTITAVALVQFSKAGCDISLFCDGLASMPPDVGPDLSIIYVEVNPSTALFSSSANVSGCNDHRVECLAGFLPMRSRTCPYVFHSSSSMSPSGQLCFMLLVCSVRFRWRLCLQCWWLS